MRHNSLTTIINYLLIILSLFWSMIFLIYSDTLTWKGFKLVTQSNWLGIFSTWTGLVTLTFFIIKSIQKKQLLPYHSQLKKSILQYVHTHHILFGVTTFITTLAHGIYFLIHSSEKEGKLITGWIGFGLLILLVFAGFLMLYRMKRRNVQRIHRWLGILFTLVVFLHAGGWQITFLLVTTIVFIVILSMQKIKAYYQ